MLYYDKAGNLNAPVIDLKLWLLAVCDFEAVISLERYVFPLIHIDFTFI